MTGPSHFFDVAGSSSDELAKTFSWSKRCGRHFFLQLPASEAPPGAVAAPSSAYYSRAFERPGRSIGLFLQLATRLRAQWCAFERSQATSAAFFLGALRAFERDRAFERPGLLRFLSSIFSAAHVFCA